VGVDFGRFYIGMSHEFLDDADVDAVFQHVGGEGMPDGGAVLATIGGPHVDEAAFDADVPDPGAGAHTPSA